MTQQTKSQELAERITDRNHKLKYSDCNEAAAHILAQDAEIERLEQAEEASKEVFGQIVDQKQDVEKRLSDVMGTIQSQQSVIAAMQTERDKARDALRVCVDALEKSSMFVDHDGSDSDLDRHYEAIKQANEVLK